MNELLLNTPDALHSYMDNIFAKIDDDKEKKYVDRIESVVNVFETSKALGDYDEVVVYRDGKGKTEQVTFGKAQTTEQGNLPLLLKMYVNNGGMFAEQFGPFIKMLDKKIPMAHNGSFRMLLKQSAEQDPVMRDTQDQFFMQYYLKPAVEWFKKAGFIYPLSLLVVYDSFIHSGGILTKLRKRFKAMLPAAGGEEKDWISSYVVVRKYWLKEHSNPILRKTVYRMEAFQAAIVQDNWNMDKPINAQGINI